MRWSVACLAVLLIAAQDNPFSRKRGPSKKAPAKPAKKKARSTESPNKPPGTRDAVARALQYLASNQEEDGGWKSGLASTTGRVVVTSYAGLALMAAGETYAAQVDKAVGYVQQHLFDPPTMKDPKWDQTNWPVTIGGVFLGEAAARGAKERLRPTLERVIQEIGDRMEPSGGWGHYHGGPCALDYVELEVMSTWALGALGILKREGLRIPQDQVSRGIRFIQDCTGGSGAVGYSPRRSQKGRGEEGRTGGAIWIFGLHGQTGNPIYGPMRNWWKGNLEGATNCHGSIAMGCLGAGLGGRQLGDAEWNQFVSKVFPKLLSHQDSDGSFRPIQGTGAGSVGGDKRAGPNYNTALYALTMQLDLGNLGYLGVRQR